MKKLFFLFAVLISCSPKTYTTPEVGMSYGDFVTLCGIGLNDDTNTVTNSKGSTVTITLRSDDSDVVVSNKSSNRSEKSCVGTFTFINDQLDSITR